MTQLQQTLGKEEYIRQLIRDEMKYSNPRMAIVVEAYPHNDPDDDSNYEVDLALVGTEGSQPSDEDDELINGRKTLERIPVSVSLDGASRGLVREDLVIVEYLEGDPSEAIVTQSVYGAGDGDRAPLTEEGDFRRRIGENAIIEIITDEDDNTKLNLGRQPNDRDGIDMGLTFNLDGGGFCLFDDSENGLFFDGEGNGILKWQSMAQPTMAAGDVNFGSSSDSPSSEDMASQSGMDEAENLAAGMSTTSLAGAQSSSDGVASGIGVLPRLPNTWTQATFNAEHIPEPVVDETVNLFEEGLRRGDVIDSYLEEYFDSNTKVEIPAGEYEWRGDGLTGNYENAMLVGLGGVVELHQPTDADFQPTISVSGGGFGSVHLANLAFRETADTDGAFLRIQCVDELASAVCTGVYLPDGGSCVGIGVSPGHEGELHVRNCVVQEFAEGGIHASSPGMPNAGNGVVHVEGGLYRNNGQANVIIGSDESSVKGAVVDSDTVARGIWLTESGDEMEINECDIIQRGSGSAVQASSPTGTTSGTMTDIRIRNSDTAPPVSIQSDHTWTGDDVYLTGEGEFETVGGDIETVTEDAKPAGTVPRRVA